MAAIFRDGTGFCPWHKRDSSFRTVQYTKYASPLYRSPNVHPGSGTPAPDVDERAGLRVLECLHCNKSLVLLETAVMLGRFPLVEGPISARMIWPHESPRGLNAAAPEAVQGLFEEASTCEKAGAFRAAAVMYRAAVEELVKDQGASEWGLKAKIKNLKGTLPDELIEDLHEARMLGDDSIHKGITYSAEEVEDVAQLIEEAVLVLYVQPEEKRAMREARKARRSGSKT